MLKRNRWVCISVAGLILLAGVEYYYVTIPRIDRNRVYVMGYGRDKPVHFADDHGNPSGLAVSIMREAARRQGIQLRWVQSNTPGIASVERGEVDFWVLVADLPERHKLVHITEPYLVTEYCLIVPADSSYRKAADLATARIA